MPPQTPPGQDPAATPQAAPPEQQGSFDYLGDLRKRYPKLSSQPDKALWDYLGQPENFRKVYPKYEGISDIEIEKNIERLSKLHPQAQAAPPTKPPVTAPVTGRPPTPGTTAPTSVAPTPDKAAPPQAPPQQQPYVTEQERQAQLAQQALIPRPKWDTPQAIAQDPTWYGRSLRYAGGELIGAVKGTTGMAIGGMKVIHDVASALDPWEGQKRALGDPQAQVGRDIVDIGKGAVDLGRLAWEMMKSNDAAADPEAFGSALLQMAFTVEGGAKAAEALKASGAPQFLNKARVGTYNSMVKFNAVERSYVHKEGVKIAEEEILKAENKARAHVKEHATNLTTKIGNKPVAIDTTVQKIKAEAAKQVKTKPPGQVARRTGIPTNVPSPLDNIIAFANSVAPGTWTWESVKQFRTMVGEAMTTASGPTKAVLTEIYVKDLTPKLEGVARQYGLEDSWTKYNDLERDIMKGFPIIDKARAIVEGNGEGEAMAKALDDSATRRELLTSLKPWGIDVNRVLKYAAKANKIIQGYGDFNSSIWRAMYRLDATTPMKLAGMALGKVVGGGGATGFVGGLVGGAGAALATNYLMHVIRAMTLDPAYLEEVLNKRKWTGPGAVPPGVGWQTPPPGPPPPGAPPQLPGIPPQPPGGPGAPGPTGPVNPPPVPGTAPPTGPTAPPAPVPGGAPPSPVAAAAAKVAEPPPAAPRTKGRPPKVKPEAEAKPPYTGPERRTTERKITQDLWAKNQIDEAKKQLAQSTDENEKNILRRRIEELQKDPTLAGGGEQLGRDIRAARAAKPAEPILPQAAKAAEPKVTKVPEGVSGREAGARAGTTRETPMVRARKQAERVSKKRAEKGPTALGGGGLEVTGGGAGEAAIKAEMDKAAQQSAAALRRPVSEWSIPEMEETLRDNSPKTWKELQEWRKGDPSLTGEDYLSALRYETLVFEDQASAMRQERAAALIKESEGRKLSPSEKKIQKKLKKED